VRKSLACCRPSPLLLPALQNIVKKITGSGAIDRPRLFIKPYDLVGGLSNMEIVDGLTKDSDRDIVTKSLLETHDGGRECSRCGGKSDRAESRDRKYLSLKWKTWEQKWSRRCICGGQWLSQSSY